MTFTMNCAIFSLCCLLLCVGIFSHDEGDNLEIEILDGKTANEEETESLPELEPEEQWPSLKHFSPDPKDWPGNGQPVGHLSPSFGVDRVKSFPSRKTFIEDYAIPAMPLVVTGAVKGGNVEKNWARDAFYTTNAFAALHRLNVSAQSKETEEMSLREFFLRKSWDTALEMETTIPDFMRIDLVFPVSFQCRPIIEALQEGKLRIFGSQKTRVSSSDSVDRWTCVAKGSQNVFLVSNAQVHRDSNYTEKLDASELTGINFDSVDMGKYPGLRFAKFYKTELKALDCIYIPAKWTQFQTTSANFIEAEITWNRRPLDSSDKTCGGAPSDKITLGLLRMEKEPEIDLHKIMYVSPLQLILNAIGQKNFTFDQLENWLKRDKKLLPRMTEWNDEYSVIAGELFLMLDLNRDSVFSADDLDVLKPDDQPLFLGRLHDRMQDFSDIMQDQQADATVYVANPTPGGGGGGKLTPEIKEYLEKYNKEMKKLIADAVAQKKKQEKDSGTQQESATNADTESRARKPKRPTLERKLGDREEEIMEDSDGSSGNEDKVSNRDQYEEEILAEEDETEVPDSPLMEKTGIQRPPGEHHEEL